MSPQPTTPTLTLFGAISRHLAGCDQLTDDSTLSVGRQAPACDWCQRPMTTATRHSDSIESTETTGCAPASLLARSGLVDLEQHLARGRVNHEDETVEVGRILDRPDGSLRPADLLAFKDGGVHIRGELHPSDDGGVLVRLESTGVPFRVLLPIRLSTRVLGDLDRPCTV